MHAAHGRAENEPQVIHPEPFRQQPVVTQNHVVVVVLREVRMQAVAWLRGFSVANAIGKNEKLARAEKLTGKLRLLKLLAAAAGAVKNQNGVRHAALRVARWLPQNRVVKPQFRKRFSRLELEILDGEIALLCCWLVLLRGQG
jgi:hypothetical protein